MEETTSEWGLDEKVGFEEREVGSVFKVEEWLEGKILWRIHGI